MKKEVETGASLLVVLLAAMTARAQTRFEQLSPAARKNYDACTDAAASKPTTEGVRIVMSTCNRHFFLRRATCRSGAMDAESLVTAITDGINKD